MEKDIPEDFVLRRPPSIKLRCLAALFRLADMLDTDYSRVKDIQRLMKKKSKVVIARESITGWTISKEDQRYIIIQPGKINDRATNRILKEYVAALNKAITDVHKKH